MKIRFHIQILLIFLALSVCVFDRHLIYYSPGGLSFLITDDDHHSQGDQPVQADDHHEDISIKTIFPDIPVPMEIPVLNFQIFHPALPRFMPHTMWQPPEKCA